MNKTEDVSLRDYVAVLRRRWLIIVSCVAVCLIGSIVYSTLQTPLYQSTSRILVQQKSSATLFDPQTGAALKPDVSTDIELQLLTSQRVREEASNRLGYPARIRATAAGEDTVILVRAVDPDAQRAADIANTFATTYLDVRRDLAVDDFLATNEVIQAKVGEIDAELDEVRALIAITNAEADPGTADDLRSQESALLEQRAQYQQSADAVQLSADLARGSGPQIIAEALPPPEPYRPTPLRNAIIGGVIGLLLGIGLAFVIDHLDDSIRRREDVEEFSDGLATLAVIPRVSGWRNREETVIISVDDPFSSAAEAYRSLRTSVQFAGIERRLKIIQMTSPNPGEGKTTTAVNLGVVLARMGSRVVVADCDLRRPRLHMFLGADPERGFTSYLLHDVALADALQRTDVPGLVVLPAGPVPPAPSELLSTTRVGETIRALADGCDILIIDSPPVLPVTDALMLSDLVDGVIVVATAGKTKRSDLRRAVESLRQVDAPLIGTVLNQADPGGTYGYYYGRYESRGPITEPSSGANGSSAVAGDPGSVSTRS